jgi:thiol:disulfide interchange protein DsbD
MRIRFSTKRLFLIVFFIVFLLPQLASGETSPFVLHATLLKERISAGNLVPVSVTFSISPNHHIYKDQIRVESVGPLQFTVIRTELPPGKVKYDQFLEKEVESYEGMVEIKSFIRVPEDIPANSYLLNLRVHYQGCTDKVCFAPKTEEFILPLQVVPADKGVLREEEALRQAPEPEKKAEASGFQKTLESRGIFLSFILIFLAGIGLSFTPCVYPMIPITIAVIGQAAGDQVTTKKPLKAFLLSLIYVLGIAVVYAAMGIVAASTGALFGVALQSPWVIGFIVVIFVALAMSMFGVYYLRVPSFISDRLGSHTRRGSLGVFIMGLISGIVASPCIGPALASLLVYIASTGNKFLGFWMLFIFAWGLGVPLIILGTFSGAIKALPKSGMWMETVERVFGLLLLGAALYYIRLIIPESVFIIILGLFLIITAVFSGGFDRLTYESSPFQRVKKSFGIVVFIFGSYFLVGYLMINGLILPAITVTTPHQQATVPREEINWIAGEEEGLRMARNEDKVAMIDFWASWCAACMELEKITYTDPEVVRELKRFVNIKIDCTNTNDPKVKQLLAKYDVVGLPTIVFINKDGTIARDKTITGFVNPEEFLQVLRGFE